MTQTAERTYHTPRELAAMTGIKVDKIYGWIESGELKAANLAENGNGERPRWRIWWDDWQAFLDGRANKPAEPKPTRRRRKSVTNRQWV